MWKEVGFILGLVVVVEIGYRLVDYFLYRLNNISGEMDEEE
tara:strand:+ start:223 stop:345 length:123 start_codon:yes stop_codon:yes gene_type:complete